MIEPHEPVALSTQQHMWKQLASRRSHGRVGNEPVPRQVLEMAIQSALWAPDHRRLQPWQFMVVEGDARQALGDLMVAAQKAQDPESTPAVLDKVRLQPLRAPVIVVAILRHRPDDKVPVFEQLLSMGAAIENFLLMIEAQGYQAIWRTGLLIEQALIRHAFGLAALDQICGMIYIGRALASLPPHEPVPLQPFMTDWNGPTL